MEKVKSLVTYREYGCTPQAYYDYRFIIGKDNQCRMTFMMNTGYQKLYEQTESVPLDEEELRSVYRFYDSSTHHVPKKKESVNAASSFSVIFNGKREFQEDVNMQKRMDQIIRIIRGNHPEELGEEIVGKIYDSMVSKMGINETVQDPITK